MVKASAGAVLLGVAVCAVLAIAAAHANSVTVQSACKGSKCSFHANWVQGKRAAPLKLVPLVFAVKQKNLELLEHLLQQVSDPDSPMYGQHLSHEEVGALFSNKEATTAVQKWLRDNGVTHFKTTTNGDFIKVFLPAAKAEALLRTKYFHFHSKLNDDKTVLRTHVVHMPADVAQHVDFVGYTTHFPSPLAARPPVFLAPRADETDADAKQTPVTTPKLIFDTYNVEDPVVKNGASQAVFESLKEFYSTEDLQSFFDEFGISNSQTNKIAVIGPNDQSNPGGEASLDIQYMMAVAQNAPTTFWSFPADNQEPFLDWILAVSNAKNPPLVHSVSYGDIEQQMDTTEMQRFDTEVQKLGLRGVTVVISSGDDGSANFGARNDSSQCGFHPSFPASSSFVTAVGATMGPEMGQPEVGCQSDKGGLITTGGGFSTYFKRPAYQADAVTAFLKKTKVPRSMFAATGRGYPDVALLGHNYQIKLGGQDQIVSGTSASAPVFAALVTLINDARIGAGKPPVGFANPLLYKLAKSNPTVFHDITSGNIRCAAGEPGSTICCKYGFSATAGWDPVGGLGSVNFGLLLQAALAA